MGIREKILSMHPQEFAPGIPVSRDVKPIPVVRQPEVWEFAAQRHDAEKAGPHIDLRLVDPEGNAHSWAIPKGRLPTPGERLLAVIQPTHTREYAALKGEFVIPEGYGKGRVYAPGLQPIEVVEASPDKIRFNIYGGQGKTQEYALLKTPKGYLLHNVSVTKEGIPGVSKKPIPHSKPPYREVKDPDDLDFETAKTVHQAKIDGAHVTIHLHAGRPMRVFSYRPTERDTGVIEHTHKIPDWYLFKVPAELHDTVLRGEIYGWRDGKAIPNSELAGLLNATTWTSRRKQLATGTKLRHAIFDVVRFRGKDMEHAPYAEKLKVLQYVQKLMPNLHLPPMAIDPEDKKKLFERIATGKEPHTEEGIVEWHLEKATPTKFKFRPDYDVEVVGVTKGTGKFKDAIGALVVRFPGKEATTHVGTGLSEELRREIAKNPESYIGRVAKVYAQQVFPSGKLRAPSFVGWHLEKGKQPLEKHGGVVIPRWIYEKMLRSLG